MVGDAEQAERNRICTVELSDFSHVSSPSGYFLIPNSLSFHFSLTTIKQNPEKTENSTKAADNVRNHA